VSGRFDYGVAAAVGAGVNAGTAGAGELPNVHSRSALVPNRLRGEEWALRIKRLFSMLVGNR
jgi:hypothetical protein